MDVRTRVCLSVCAFLCVQIPVIKSLPLTRDEKQIIDYTEITIRATHVRNRRDVAGITKNTDDDGILPSAVDMDFEVKKEKISFHLGRNDRISTNAPVYLMRKGGIKRMDLPPIRNTTFYNDVKSGATVQITCARSEKRECTHLVTGMFMYQNEIVMIEPDEYKDDEGENITGSKADKAGGPRRSHNQMHIVFTTKFKPNIQSDYFVPEGKPLPLFRAKDFRKMLSRNKRSIEYYQVELLCVVDFPIYDFWHRRSTATTDDARSADAVETVREFYAFVINAIDLRYQSIVSRQISIRVLFGGIYIAQTPSDSPWTENNTIHANVARDQVDSRVALSAFANWISTQSSFPKYDHVMAFTGYDLTGDSTENAGLAPLGGICNFSGNIANSIVEDHFEASMAIFAAHELGHNLGATHDGNNNMCLASDGYVMSPSVGGITDAKAINKWKFSTCSVMMFEKSMDKLKAASSNCLLNLTTSYDPSASTSYQDIMPGQEYGIDTQCELIIGAASIYCRAAATDGDVCQVIYCSIPDREECRTATAWEGTSCGNSMWCQAGKCVSDTRAPARNSMCVHGNQPGIVKDNMTCEQLISSLPNECALYNKKCCKSCAPYYTGRQGCEYGDFFQGCKLSDCSKFPKICCGTCNTTYLVINTATASDLMDEPIVRALLMISVFLVVTIICIKKRTWFGRFVRTIGNLPCFYNIKYLSRRRKRFLCCCVFIFLIIFICYMYLVAKLS